MKYTYEQLITLYPVFSNKVNNDNEGVTLSPSYELVSLSIRHKDDIIHMVAEHSALAPIDVPDVWYADDETTIVTVLLEYLESKVLTHPDTGTPTYHRLIAAWRMYDIVWPKLMGIAIRDELPVPKWMKSALDSKWPRYDFLGDILNIYKQTAYLSEASIPSLTDFLRNYNRLPIEYEPVTDIVEAFKKDPRKAAHNAGTILNECHELILQYINE